MISNLLSQLQGQYTPANAPDPAPAVGDPNGLTGLLQTTGIPVTQNPMGMRTPNYMGLLGMMGQQPFTPGYQPMAGGMGGTGTSDYLDRVLGGIGGGTAQGGFSRPSLDMFTQARVPSPAELARYMSTNQISPFQLQSALPPRV